MCCSLQSRSAASSHGARRLLSRRRCRHDRRGAAAARAGLRKRRAAVFAGAASAAARSIAVSWCARAADDSSCGSTRTRGADPGLDRDRELALHTAAAGAGIAPQIIYACPDHSCLITDYVEGRLWTPHYFTRMRDLRSLGQRLRALHALAPPSGGALRSPGRGAPLRGHHRAQRTRRGRAHPALVSQRRPKRWRARVRSSAPPASCTATCTTATC